jgi:hypothetical protein
MLALRKFLRTCYGYLTLIFSFAAFFAVPSLIRTFQRHSRHSVLSPDTGLWRAVFPKATELIIAIPIPVALLFGFAWWTLNRGKPSGRIWAIVASVVSIVLHLPMLISVLGLLGHGTMPPTLFSVLLPTIMAAIGVAGLVAFASAGSGAPAIAKPKQIRVKGDGTNRLFDTIVWGIAIVAGVAAWDWSKQWGYAHRLPRVSVSLWWLEFVVASLVTTTAHELGHAVVGTALGMKLHMFLVGPFQWRIRDGKWKFEFVLTRLLSGGGATSVVPTNPKQSKWIDIAMISAGPAASLLAGLVSLLLMLTSQGRPHERAWELLALCAVLSLSAVLLNLIPFRPESLYSDGAQIYQLISGGPWADYRRALNGVRVSLVTPLRPRDYDIAAIHRAEAFFTLGHQALVLQLLASSYYIDIGDFPEAERSVAEAERICQESSLDLPVETLFAFVYRVAFLRRDALGARMWWDRMKAKRPTYFGVNYWLARAALLWVEGNLAEARQACEKGVTLAHQLPSAGDYDFERDRAAMLRQAIDEASVSEEPPKDALLASP